MRAANTRGEDIRTCGSKCGERMETTEDPAGPSVNAFGPRRGKKTVAGGHTGIASRTSRPVIWFSTCVERKMRRSLDTRSQLLTVTRPPCGPPRLTHGLTHKRSTEYYCGTTRRFQMPCR